MDLYSILGQPLTFDEALPPETAPAAAALAFRAQPSGAAQAADARTGDFAERGLMDQDQERDANRSISAGLATNGQGPSAQEAGERTQPSSEEYTLALRLLAEDKLRSALAACVERVRYITNASGVALALCEPLPFDNQPEIGITFEGSLESRPENSEDAMICHASSGPAAPEVGARMYIRSGLTGESIRSRQVLRCDRASTDPRVNQESCKALGIESVMVLPLILDRNVVGMLELFGSKPSAFVERDANTLRLSTPQVESALREAVAAGMPLGRILWAEEALAPDTFSLDAPRLVETKAVETRAAEANGTDACEAGAPPESVTLPESVTIKVPVVFPAAVPIDIDTFRKAESAVNPKPERIPERPPEQPEEQEVPAFLARLADEARPAPRTWSQWFRPQW